MTHHNAHHHGHAYRRHLRTTIALARQRRRGLGPRPPLPFGALLADAVAATVGSWRFIVIQTGLISAWILGNAVFGSGSWDPYPFILLNLLLSFQAAYTAPVIMMSQNRQAAKDRINAAHDYEVNLKAEIEIMALHDKLDHMRTREIEAILQRQQEQIDLMRRLLEARER